MSFTKMHQRKRKAVGALGVCYRCAAHGRAAKVKRYGSMEWCERCAGELKNLGVNLP